MKQRLTSVIAARQKRPSRFLNARLIVGVLCIILIFATPAAGSANQSPSGLSAQISSYETMVPTWTQTASPSMTASPTWTPTPTQTATPTNTPTPHIQIDRPQILVSTNNVLYVYTQTGELLESYEIPYPIEPRPYIEKALDIIPGPNKTIFVYNGTNNPYLSILDRNSGTWTHTTYPGWSTISYGKGGIGRFSKYIYLTDMYTSQNEESGILRFNTRDGSYTSHALGIKWNTLTIGQDNLLYANKVWSNELQVLDPISMQGTDRVLLSSLSYPDWSIAVNAEGDIFGVALNSNIYHFNNTGLLLNTVRITSNLYDIDISEKGQFVVSGSSGLIIVLDENLVLQNYFFVYPNSFYSYVAFVPGQ